TGPLVGAGRGGSIRSGGVGVDGCARSAQQIMDQTGNAPLQDRQSGRYGPPLLRDGDADCAFDAAAGQRPLATTPRPRCRELLDRQNASGARASIYDEPVLNPMLSFLGEFWSFLRVRKKYWLVPIFVMMIILGGLVVLTKGSAVAPFIYTLF